MPSTAYAPSPAPIINLPARGLLATPSPAAETPAGVWLSLERLRELPLTAEARLALLRDLQAAQPPQATALALSGELAEVTLRCCEDAYNRGDWRAALELHDALVPLVEQLARAVPERAAVFWARYGELLAFFTAAVHAAVKPESAAPPEPWLRAQLCSQMAERLAQGRLQPLAPPDWLAVLEEQLVQYGAGLWQELVPEGTAGDQLEADQQALQLLLRLHTLLEPAPEWVLGQAKRLLERWVGMVLTEATPDPHALAALLDCLDRLPLCDEQQGLMSAAVMRAGLALELLAPELGSLFSSSPVADAEAASAPADVLQAASPQGCVAELVWLDPRAEPSPLQLDVQPLLEAEFNAIDAALDDFIWHLPKGCLARQAALALQAALELNWAKGLRLRPAAFERLAYLAAGWQRRLADRLEPLPRLDWQHGVLVELDATELAVLRPLLEDPHQLEPVLAELRREHHNGAFWQQRHEVPWMQCPPPLEALRRLHVDQGFYAHSHESLQSLMGWGRDLMQALLDAELWTDDAASLGLWFAVAQELVLQGQGPLPLLGHPPAAEELLRGLGGLEVVYVGDQAAAVRVAHQAGRCFRGEPFGLRVLEPPASCWPARPAGSFEESLAVLLEAVDGLYRQRPFAVLLADCGAYRLPLLRAAHQRYGVAALSSGRPVAGWLAG